jgi:multidrug resistance efflux pump
MQPRIKIPPALLWREIRIRVVPVLTFVASLVATIVLWRQQAPATTLLGEAEATTARVVTAKQGIVAHLNLHRWDTVNAGQALGEIITTEPEMVRASLAVIQAEMDLIRSSFSPDLDAQRLAISSDRLRLDWMEQRVSLAAAKAQLQLAENNMRRAEQLFQQKVVSQQTLEEARTARDQIRVEIDERQSLISAQEKSLQSLQPSTPAIAGAPAPNAALLELQASIKVQEEKLKLTEMQLSPSILRAPIDGTVTTLHRHNGESVAAGETIVTIQSTTPDRIVAYLRQPFPLQPVPGMPVEIRTRAYRREIAASSVERVGTHWEEVSAPLRSPGQDTAKELGLPILITRPPGLRLAPGELVELRLKALP